MSEIIIYDDGVVSLETTVEENILWLSQEQIAELFAVQRPAITNIMFPIVKTT